MTEEEKLRTALQKIADLPATQQGNRANPMLRAKRISLGALGANQKAIQKFNDNKRKRPTRSTECAGISLVEALQQIAK